LHSKEENLIKQFQFFFGVGSIQKIINSVRFKVQSPKDLNNVIIPHFDKYPLVSQKRADYILFKSILEMMNRREHLTKEGVDEIVRIRASLNLGLSQKLKAIFDV
jgi:hypothetical protein